MVTRLPLHTPQPAADAHTQRARARHQARGRNGRPEDRTLSRSRPSLLPGCQCGAREGRMHAVSFREFLRVPPPTPAGAPLHVCSGQTRSVSGPPCATRMHGRRGLCANRSACLLVLDKIPRLHPTLSLSSHYGRRARVTHTCSRTPSSSSFVRSTQCRQRHSTSTGSIYLGTAVRTIADSTPTRAHDRR